MTIRSHGLPSFKYSYLTYGLVVKDTHLAALIEYHCYELRLNELKV